RRARHRRRAAPPRPRRRRATGGGPGSRRKRGRAAAGWRPRSPPARGRAGNRPPAGCARRARRSPTGARTAPPTRRIAASPDFRYRSSQVEAALHLTKRQKELLDYLDGYIAEHGYAPTLEEIGSRFTLN